MKVLIVAAEHKAASVVRQLGHEVVATPICANALDKATVWRPDLVLIDLTWIEGQGLAKSLREDSRERPVIGIVSALDSGQHKAAVDAGFDEFLAKPFRPNELTAILKRAEARIAASETIAERVRVSSQLACEVRREKANAQQKSG